MRKQLLMVVGALVVACSDNRSSESEEHVAQVAAALTTNQRVLSFDGSMGANGDWRALSGVATSSAVHIEGSAALSLSGGFNPSALSVPLSTLGPLTSNAGLQVSLPTSLSGQSWLGQVALFFNAPSAGVYNQYAGPVVLNGPLGSFQHYNIPIPPNVVSALSSKTYSDLTVTVQLNVPNTSGAFLVDALTLTAGGGGSGGTGGAGGSGGKASGGASAGGTSGSGGTAGKGGSAGTGGTAGKGGSAGTGGVATGGTAGKGGGAGTSGTSGSSGSAGAAGSSGAGGTGGSASSFDFAIRTPKGVHAADVVVGMESYLEADDGVRFIEETSTSTHSSLSNIAQVGAPSYFGVQSELQNLWTGTGTDLRNRAHVYGFIQSSIPIGKQIDTIIDGAVTQNAVLSPYEELAWKVTFPGTSLGGYSVDGGLSKTLAPGSRYDDFFVTNNATLHLDPGTYYFNSLTIEPGGRLEVANSAPVFVYVRQGLIFRGTISESQPKANTLYGLASHDDEPMAALDIEAPFRGIVVAPHGFMNLGTTSTGHVGSFFGAAFRANAWTPIYHRKLDPTLVTGLHCQNGVRDGDETDVDCGGSCGPCARGGGCTLPTDCGAGLVCGTGNGACFGGARAKGVCWPTQCADGVDPTAGECGKPDSPCGANCACATGCDSTIPNTCPAGEVCAAGLGNPLGVSTPDVCLDPRCPSNDPSLCGGRFSVCGPCICKPDCSHATCSSPGDGCGGQCPNVCGMGDTGTSCGSDLHCPAGAACITNPDGSRSCRPAACATQVLVPPLCGMPGAPCGQQCPQCDPACTGRQCGPDPACGTSCGTCNAGSECDAAGQCVTPTTEPPPTVPDGNGGKRDVPPLPQVAASAVGPVHGGFSVSEVGTPEYTVPIEVPPGRAGLEPSLSLKYSGTRVTGDLGMGWSLEGLSKITRCPHTFALDGYAGPITNTVTDALCLDGKRLSQVSGGPLPNIPIEYRTLIDSFAKIVAYQDQTKAIHLPWIPNIAPVIHSLQGPDYFKVWTKDGRILTYGGGADSLIMARNGVRNTWLLTRVEDRAGNNILITYDNAAARLAPDGGLSLIRPSVITYTGHGDSAGNRQVRFTYEERPDNDVRYFQGGVGWLVRERLSRIATYVHDAPVKNYRLVYAEQDRSQIEKVFECEGEADSRCKAPTVFTYAQETGFTPGQSSMDLQGAVQLDIDGNGFPDFLQTSVIRDGVKARPELKAAEIGTDIAVGIATSFMTLGTGLAVTGGYTMVKLAALGLMADRAEIDYAHTMWLGNGRRQIPTATAVQNIQGLPCTPIDPLTFLDYDRDGKDDAVGTCGGDTTWQGVYVSRSDGSGNFQRFPNATDPVLVLPKYYTTDATNRYTSFNGPAPVFVDVDGDSLEDAVYCVDRDNLGVRRRLGPALGFDAAAQVPQVAAPMCNMVRPTILRFDIDGDGATDMLVNAPDGWKALRYQHSQSAGGTATLTWQDVYFQDWNGSGQGNGITLADFNGDGLVDVWSADGSQGIVWLNAGGAKFLQKKLLRPLPGQNAQFSLKRTALLDYDSDGRSDVVDNYEHFKGDFNGEKLYEWDNWTLTLNGDATELHSKHASDFLVPLGPNSTLVQSPMGIVTDIDGDGNSDMFALQGAVLYGTGSHNMLLKHVVDGVGNFVDIDYDGANRSDAHYVNDCDGPSWPEPCVKQMHGLVSTERAGYVDAGGSSFVERTTQYTYRNGRMSATGHGWLGFDSRSVRVSFTNGNSTLATTDFGAPVRTTLTGAPVQSDNEPYIYPFAGLPKSVTIDGSASTALERPPLEDSDFGYRRRTRTETTWEVGLSATGRPFPKVTSQTTSTFEHERPEIVIGDPPPDIDDGTLLFACAESFGHDSYGNVTNESKTCTDAAGNVMEYDTTGTEVIPDPSTWLIANPTDVVVSSHRGNWTYTREVALGYDERGLLKWVARGADTNTDAWQRTDYLRNDFGNPEHVIQTVKTGEPQRTTDITYDSDQVFPETITNAKQQTTQLRFDTRWGMLGTAIDPNNIITRRSYDGLGLLAEADDPAGTTVYTYAAAPAQLVTTSVGDIHPRIQVSQSRQGVAGSRSGSVVSELDYRGRVVRTQAEGLGGTTIIAEQTYDATGRPASATVPHTLPLDRIPSVTYTYDGFDRLTRLTRSDGSFVQHQYADTATLGDGYRQWLNNLDCAAHGDLQSGCPVSIERTIDEEGRQNVLVRDHVGLPVRNVDGEHIAVTDRTSDYFYGGFNSLQVILDAAGSYLSYDNYGYDDYGRRLTSTDRNGVSTTSTYSGYDEISTTLDSKGQQRVYKHDDLGRLTQIQDGAAFSQWIYDEGPNALGRLSATISPATDENPNGQRLIYTYEPVPSNPERNRGALQRIEQLIDGVNYAVGFEYDDLARTKRVHYPTLDAAIAPPVVTEYQYDPAVGVLTGVDEVGASATRQLWRLTKAYQGQLVQSETFGNKAATTYTYDPERRFLTDISTTLPLGDASVPDATNLIQKLTYEYYQNGRVHTRTNAADAAHVSTRVFDYDALNRLYAASDRVNGVPFLTTRYGYDLYGNLTQRGSVTTTYLSNQPHFIDAVGANTYHYDANGNVELRSGPDIPGSEQAFSYTPFDMPRTITTGGITTQFDYSADQDRLVRRDPDTTRHFIGQFYQRLLNNASQGTLEERFRLFAGGRNLGEIVRAPGTPERTLFFHTDHLENVDTISTSNGEVVHQEFDVFGAPTATAANGTELTRAGFTGHQHDVDLGLIDMRGRVYDPLAGRFTTQDPVRQAPFWSQGLNPYSYVFNDPINHTDPSGFATDDWSGGAGIMGWGVGTTGIAAASAHLGGFALGAGANIGVSALVGDPFAGSGPKSQSVAAGAHTSDVKGGGTAGGNAISQNRPPREPDRRLADNSTRLPPGSVPYTAAPPAAPPVEEVLGRIVVRAISTAARVATVVGSALLTTADSEEDPDENLPLFLVLESVTPNIYRNTVAALADGKPYILTRTTDPVLRKANRAAAIGNRSSAGAGKSWDEYPYASTHEGGAGARVEAVPAREQNIQGGLLSGFYSSHNIGEGARFRVLTVPKGETVIGE